MTNTKIISNLNFANIFDFNIYTRNLSIDKQIVILQLNACSFLNLNRFDYIKQLFDFIEITVDIAIFSETWLKNNICRFYNLSGFQSFFTNRDDKKGGGLVVYIRNNIKCNLLSKRNDLIFNIWLEIIDLSIDFKKFYIGAYYRPPNSKKNNFLKCFRK